MESPSAPRPRSRGLRRSRGGGQREQGYAAGPGIWGLGGRLAWISGLVLTLAPFLAWYAGDEAGDGLKVSVTGWDTGALGKLILLLGLALILIAVLRQAGIELPAAVPESLLVIAIGSLATVFVLIRLISIPEEFFFAGRAVGIWISLAAAIAAIIAGLLEASEEL